MHTDRIRHHEKWRPALMLALFLLIFSTSVWAEDSDISRRTLAGVQSMRVLVEDIPANIRPYLLKAGITEQQIQRDVENRLRSAGIKIVSGNQWLKMMGRPMAYVNINTHETEKYWYAYDIKFELRQIVSLEARPKIKTLADTWSINMTGITNTGNLHVINNNAMVLTDRFIQAYKAANQKKAKR